jgi:hypothetical protein
MPSPFAGVIPAKEGKPASVQWRMIMASDSNAFRHPPAQMEQQGAQQYE